MPDMTGQKLTSVWFDSMRNQWEEGEENKRQCILYGAPADNARQNVVGYDIMASFQPPV